MLNKGLNKISFKRITTSGNFIPEIDSLRFIAIFSVVLYHVNGFLSEKDLTSYKSNYFINIIQSVFKQGHIGVPLFFVISGFILGIPFAKHFINKEPKVIISEYFKKRLTRLEPPYILSLIILFLSSVFIVKKLSFSLGFKSFIASIFYVHNFVFPNHLPYINSPTWSLEIEIQFYIFAPILALYFSLNKIILRRIIILVVIFFSLLINNFIEFRWVSIFSYLHYFLLGFLLLDYYLNDNKIIVKSKVFEFILMVLSLKSIIIFIKSYINNENYKTLTDSIQLFSIFIFYQLILINRTFFLKYNYY